MNMHNHMLAAMREQFDEWNDFIAGLNAEQLKTPLAPSPWTLKDVLAHLTAWQQRSIARFKAARGNQPPEMPAWMMEDEDPDSTATLEIVNERIYRGYKHLSWEKVLQEWCDGYHKLLELAGKVDEPMLLDSDRFPWLEGYSLADVLLGSYDHHQEHLDSARKWLQHQ